MVDGRLIRALKACPERSEGRRLGEGASPEGLTPVLRDGRSSRAGPLGHGLKRRLGVIRSRRGIGIVLSSCDPCAEASARQDASPEGLTPSFRTLVVAEPAL